MWGGAITDKGQQPKNEKSVRRATVRFKLLPHVNKFTGDLKY